MTGDAEPSRKLVDSADWLSQGDIFSSVPLADVGLRDDHGLHLTQSNGPAVLVTHDCVLDKRNKGGLTIERIYVLPLLTTTRLDEDLLSTLRGSRGKLKPYEAMYLGEVSDLGECYFVVSDPKLIPAGYFDLTVTDLGHGDLRATPRYGGARLGKLCDDDVHLLRLKWAVYWTRMLPQGGPN